jgi:hypothetical protein
MDEMFKNLKETLNETVLRDIDFGEKNKEKVRQTINIKKKRKFQWKPIFNSLLGIAAACLFFIGTGYFIADQLGAFSGNDYLASKDNMKNEIKQGQQNGDGTLYIPPAKKESYEDMTKEDVVLKMLNTVDYFHTAAGKFEYFQLYDDQSASIYTVEYKHSIKKRIGGYEKNINYHDKALMGYEESVNEIIYDDQKIWMKESEGKTYHVSDYQQPPRKDKVTPEEAFSIDLRKLYDSSERFRERLPAGGAGISLFPYEIAAGYLRNTDQWDIEKQNEEVLGHNTIVLYGKIEENQLSRMKAETATFRFWVDKDTGILVKYQEYNNNGDLTSYMQPTQLEVNIPVDTKDFVPHLEDYQKYEPLPDMFERDPKEKEIKVVDHADTYKEDIEAVMEILRKDAPFMYEFTHSDLKLFSASYERYQDYNHAYQVYSYKKDSTELGSGHRLLYVRAYHKDSIIRSTDEFIREKGERLEEFKSNDIKWESYEIKNTPEFHFIGKKGNYKYEVVSQDITYQETKDLLGTFKPIN